MKTKPISGVAFRRAAALAAVSLAFLWTGTTNAGPQSSNASNFEFEVASIKPSDPGGKGATFLDVPGTAPVQAVYSTANMPLIMVIRAAYGLPMKGAEGRISGAPGWLESERYDIEAKIDDETVAALNKLSGEERKAALQQMILKLLADRCKFTVHLETKDLPVYRLEVAKNGPKLKEEKPGSASGDDPSATKQGTLRMKGRGGPLVGEAAPIAMLVNVLAAMTGRTVIDETELAGKYDFTLQWSPDDNPGAALLRDSGAGAAGGAPTPAADSNFPPLLTAIQEQLGLKLESGKGPVQIVVIDHVERPSAN